MTSSDVDSAGGRSAPPLTPSAAKRALGEQLRAVRLATGLRLDQAAVGIQRSAATLSRLETGKSSPRLVDVRALLEQYVEKKPEAVPNGTAVHIVELAEIARTEEWFAPFRDVISSDMTADDHQRFVEFESDATRISNFEPELLPGLLQTADYAAAVAKLFFPGRSDAERQRFVEFRVARQHVLSRDKAPLELDVVIGEAALRRVMGSADAMRGQVRAVLDNVRNGQPNVRIRIAPISLSIPAVVGGPFMVMDLPGDDEPGLVYLESRGGATYSQDPAELARYRQLVVDMADAVLDRDDSIALLEEVLKDLG